jgi:transposase
MILALVVDADGRPICTEMVPGNTADVTVLVPVVDRLRARFGITRACFVADRGMISADTIAALEKRGMDYILGARERSSSVVRDIVLNDDGPMVPLALDRQHGETQLWVKEVRVGQQRYIVSLNEAEALRRVAAQLALARMAREAPRHRLEQPAPVLAHDDEARQALDDLAGDLQRRHRLDGEILRDLVNGSLDAVQS